MIRFVKEDKDFCAWQIANEFIVIHEESSLYFIVSDNYVYACNSKATVRFTSSLKLENGAYKLIKSTNKDIIIEKVDAKINIKNVEKIYNDSDMQTDTVVVQGFNADILTSKVLYEFSKLGACIFYKHVSKVCKWLPYNTSVSISVSQGVAHMYCLDIHIMLIPLVLNEEVLND
jgi:hypothetical protein